MTSNVDVTNRVLAQIGSRSQVTSMVDGSQEAFYANLLYVDLRDFLLREGDYDFSMVSTGAIVSGVADVPWVFSYTYPGNCIRIRQLIPVGYIVLDPQPIEWNVINSGGIRRIVTKISVSNIIYTTNTLSEDVWDPIFTQSFERLLGSALAFALQNRIEASKEKLSEALSFAGIANMRDS
jgi:hypothetical protein